MPFDGITLSALVRELKPLAGQRITKISQPDSHSVTLAFRTEKGLRRLFLSADPSMPLLYVTDTNLRSPDAAPAFCMLLRKYMQGARVEAVTQPGLERAVRISFRHSDELGDIRNYTLVTELMGKHSNIILIDDNDRVIDAIRHVPPSMSSVRIVLPGSSYFLPETKDKEDFLSATPEDFMRKLASSALPVSEFLNVSWQGISRVVAEEVCARTRVSPEATEDRLSPAEMSSVYLALRGIIDEAALSPDLSPPVYFRNGTPVEFSPVPLSTCEGLDVRRCETMSEALILYYSERQTRERMKQKSAGLRKTLSSILSRDVKKLSLQEKQLRDTEKMERFRTYGELLLIYGYSVKPGDTCIVAEDYRTGENVKIPLDPTLSFKQNSERFFSRYNKLKRTKENLTRLTEDVKKEIVMLESVLQSLDMAETDGDLAEIRRELAEYGIIKAAPTKAGRKAKGNEAPSDPLHFLSRDGHHIYAGKNNRQNDYLTFSLAKPEDYWFHAKGVPGAHVILKVNENEDMPSDSAFEDAAAVAAHFSGYRDQDKGEVDYVKKREIRKPKGSYAGFVVYYTNYSMTISTDISALTQE